MKAKKNSAQSPQPALLAYIPVLHQGYLNWLSEFPKAQVLLLGEDILAQWPELTKDLRALKPVEVQKSLKGLGFSAQVISLEDLPGLPQTYPTLLMPDEEIMRDLVKRYWPEATVQFSSVFLRWDKQKSLTEMPIQPDDEISQSEFDQKMMQQAGELAHKSADWWRQVGAVLVKDGQVLLSAFNRHVPSPHQHHYDGDPRADFHKGEDIDKSTAFHAEANLIAEAARQGLRVEGCSLYVTTFPCPNCAKLVAYSGIKEVFFKEGYAMVDGERILKDRGVKIVRVT